MTTDLSESAGLAVGVEPDSGRLELGADVTAEESAVRDLAAGREVYARPPAQGPPLYYMENGLQLAGRDNPDPRLRYELTSLRAGLVGPERVKTMGHVHAPVADGLGHPELYEVLFGTAAFPLFRSRAEDGGWECVLVEAAAGERFVIPPGWHHLAVNAGDDAMVFADVVARAVVPDYTVARASVGAPVRLGNGDRIGRNPAYGPIGSFARVRASELPMPFALAPRRLWPQFASAPEDFGCLLEPGVARAAWQAFDDVVAAASATPLAALDVLG